MKKCFSFVGVIAAAAISLVSCSKEVDSPAIELVDEGIPFQIVANPSTKTSISGWQTSWAANDKINLFHAVNSTTTYVADGEFTIASEDLATGTFKGTVASPAPTSGNTYDWYAIYPSSKYIKSVHNVTSGDDEASRYYIGKRSDQAQVQTGNSSTAHLSGTNYPLFGKATSVAYDAVPAVTLSHLSSFVEVKVTNKNDDPLTVTSVAFKAPSGTELVGYFEIDFEADPVVFTPYSTYTSNVANLTVSASSAIAKDASASFYLGIKPFSIEADAEHPVTLTVSVNGYEKDLVLKKNVSFESGKYKTVNFDYDYVDSGSGSEPDVFNETFGSVASNVTIDNHSDFSASQSMFTDPENTVKSHYSSDGKVGKNNVQTSSGYEGASGNSAMWFTGTKGSNLTKNLFTVEKIDISGVSDLSVSFGLYYTNGTIGTTNTVSVYYTIDDGEEQTLSFSQPASTGTWTLCSGSITGTGSSLKIRFSLNVTGGYTARLDDITVTGTK